jgi:tRNA U38,U39,U40 pseudouridine synthase TruA
MTLVTITIRADAFLQRMVRNIVGVLVNIGRGNRHVEPLIRLGIGRGLEKKKKKKKQKSNQTHTPGQEQEQEESKLTDVREILALKDRSLVQIPPAPPQGLYLLNVHY